MRDGDDKDMQERVDELGEEIEEVREDWERKQEDPSVPGAQPPFEEVETERQDLREVPPADDETD
ncbi:MAG TPA: hypothetical protein VNT32_15175 [Thermoleophilaceae bacterium]|nr:hypothetical protein [Thermoleophilaceae bacterium]